MTENLNGPSEWAEWVDWGELPYRCAHLRQLDRVAARRDGQARDAIITVTHPHVITIGRRKESAANVLAAGGVEVVEVERGGDVTYHGPGQLVAYPILKLGEGERDLHALLRNLEQAIIDTCAQVGLAATREPGKTGVWSHGRKLASMGIACRRWVTFHGIGLNVSTDLSYFHRINPCGFDASIMTSMEAELGHSLDFDFVQKQLVIDLAAQLGRRLVADPALNTANPGGVPFSAR